MLRYVILLAGVFVLSGCYASGFKYLEPIVPDMWSGADEKQAQEALKHAENISDLRGWWMRFDDDILTHLIEDALASSPQRNIAEARIQEARGAKRTNRSTLFPQVGASGGAGRQTTVQSDAHDYYDAGFDASFELDIFGQERTRASAAQARLQAREADYHDVSLTLIADIMRAYIDYRAAQTQMRIAQRNLDIQNETLQIAKALAEVGEGPQLDVERALTLVNASRASVPSFARASDAARLQLSILTGVMPADLAPLLAHDKAIPGAEVKAVLRAPAEILALRPDVRAARYDLLEATDLADAAVRDLFPTISLNGFFGVTDGALVSSKTIWDVAANAAVAVLDFGRLEGQIDSARAREWQAFEAYRQTVIEAVVEVEKALSDYAHLNKERIALQDSFEAAQRAFGLSSDLYEEGEVGFLDVLDSQRELVAAEADFVSAQAAQAESLVRLYKSLGVY